jgi:ATP-binding cassette subfamily B protein
MKTEQRGTSERDFAPVAVEARYAAPRARFETVKYDSWVRRMLPIVRSHLGALATGWGATVLAQVTLLLVPFVLKNAINDLVGRRTASLHFDVEVLALLALGQVLAGYVSRSQMLRSAYGIEYDMRANIYEHLTRLSFSFYDRVQSGQLISRANSDIRSVQMFLAWGPNMAIQIIQLFVVLAVLFHYSPTLTLVAMVPLPAVWWVGLRMRRQMFPASWIVQSRMADVATIVEENVTGVRVVKSFAAEQDQIRKLAKDAKRLQWAAIKQVDIRANYSPYLQSLPALSLVSVLAYGGYLVMHGRISVGVIVLFSAYIGRLVAPFRMLGFLLVLHERARASAQRIYEIIDTEPDVQDKPGAIDLVSVEGDIEFRDVGFQYNETRGVLEHFSLHLAPGETVALVGRNGSGKSTAARLLMRFYDVTDGAVLVDGHDIRDVTQLSLRAHIGLVSDDAFLFSDTIRSNIAYARPDASLDEVIAAAKAAEADEFIRELPDGYDTIIGERGYDLSGGQRQRVSIARLLLKDPAILILDEATSSVDVRTEVDIYATLERVMEGRTTLLIAHRLSTINLADRIVFLDGGQIVATGTHHELLRTEPRYAAVLAQLASADLAPKEAGADEHHREGVEVDHSKDEKRDDAPRIDADAWGGN